MSSARQIPPALPEVAQALAQPALGSDEAAGDVTGVPGTPLASTEPPDRRADERACEAVFAVSAIITHATPAPLDATLRDRLLAGAPLAGSRPSLSAAQQRGQAPVEGRLEGRAQSRDLVTNPRRAPELSSRQAWWRGAMVGAGALGGGLAAAAAILLATGLWPQGSGRSGSVGSSLAGTSADASGARRPLNFAGDGVSVEAVIGALGQAKDAERFAFAPSTEDLAGVTGTVTWSDALQAGTLTFMGLPPNDPSKMQYQLWIVDPARDARPVDGGVFDIAVAEQSIPTKGPRTLCADDGSVTVAVVSRLPVKRPAAFAITREKPGGVVVSAGPLVLVAARTP
jgi:hypothetical protein